jgi:hypothetical protein
LDTTKLLSGDLAPGQATSGTISWGPSENAIPVITIKTVGNTKDQADRDCEVTLSNAVNGKLGTATAVTKIIDDDTVVTPGNKFVKVATTIGLSRPASAISRPPFDPIGNNLYRPLANQTYDLRDRETRPGTAGYAKRDIQVRLENLGPNGLLTGLRVSGQQLRSYYWQQIKLGTLFSGGSMDNDGMLFGISKPDPQHPKAPAGPHGNHIIENFWLDNVCDGINGPAAIQEFPGRAYMRTVYMRYIRDDAWEFDNFTPSTTEDCLVDGCFVGFSQRNLSPTPITEPTYLSNCLVYLQRQPYKGDIPTNGGALYTAPWSLSGNRGTKVTTFTNSGKVATGWGHQWFCKASKVGTRGYTMTADFRNCLFVLEGLPISGDSDGLPWPPGVYENVVVIYLGPGVPGSTGLTTLDQPPTGVTVLDYTHYDLWLDERDKWLRAHGDSTGTGDDFPFLHQ